MTSDQLDHWGKRSLDAMLPPFKRHIIPFQDEHTIIPMQTLHALHIVVKGVCRVVRGLCGMTKARIIDRLTSAKYAQQSAQNVSQIF